MADLRSDRASCLREAKIRSRDKRWGNVRSWGERRATKKRVGERNDVGAQRKGYLSYGFVRNGGEHMLPLVKGVVGAVAVGGGCGERKQFCLI